MKARKYFVFEDSRKIAVGAEVVFLEGDVPIMADGEVIDAVGISGVKSAENVQIAQAGIDTLFG